MTLKVLFLTNPLFAIKSVINYYMIQNHNITKGNDRLKGF